MLFLPEVDRQADAGDKIVMTLDLSVVARYNDLIDDTAADLRALHAEHGPVHFEHVLIAAVVTRLGLLLVLALMPHSIGPLSAITLSAAALALVAPFSVPVALACFFTNAQEALLHYASAYVCTVLLALLPPLPEAFELRLGTLFLLAFLIADQAACLFVYLRISDGSVKLTAGRWLHGAFNTKTYLVVLFLSLDGVTLSLPLLALTSLVSRVVGEQLWPVLQRALGLPAFAPLFYHQHRLAHLPGVYSQAHKMHHGLHDTTAFDAHVCMHRFVAVPGSPSHLRLIAQSGDR
jgi:xanthosine utilization system XapX-like protein